MATYRYEKQENGKEQIVIDGFEAGISPSPHKGFGDMKNVNISTEAGEVMANYIRVQQAQTRISGQAIIVQTSSTLLNINSGASQQLQNGTWITISGSSGTPANGTYYVFNVAGTTAQTFQIAASFKGAALSGFTGSVGTFTTINMGIPRGSATEFVSDGSNKYYILDAFGYVWVHDSSDSSYVWANINGGDATSGTSPTLNSNVPNGIAVYNGRLHVFTNSRIFSKPTSALATEGTGVVNKWAASSNNTPLNTDNLGFNDPHTALVGHDSVLYYCDGAYIGSILANATGNAINLFSNASYTAASTTVTLGTVYGGNVPIEGLPLYFYPSAGGAIPSGISDTITAYYVKTGSLSYQGSVCTFQVASTPGGSAIDMASGASGTQYFSTYNPAATGSYVWSRQALALPSTESALSLAELGTQLVVGTTGNTLYTWNRVSGNPSSYIFLPENNTVALLTTNNMVHVFSGNRGNIYITNGSTASLTLTVPDYISGQIEPYFTWGIAPMYLRGRVYFSIQQNSGTPNMGGIWSFTPTQNFIPGQDDGVALRLENQNSYGTYVGLTNLLIPSQNQAAQFPQFWSAWDNGSSVYGIDYTGTAPFATGGSSGQPIIETEIIPVGTALSKKTIAQIEYKLATPLTLGESVSIKFRTDLTSSWTSCGTAEVQANVTGESMVSGYFTAPFQNAQWIQLQILLTSTASNPSFVRLQKIYVR